jgi:plasmid maintenance system antidote protein VapI
MKKKRSVMGSTLGDQLREAIEGSGWTLYRVAKTAGIKHAVVARFVSGERDLRLETASKIAATLGLKLETGDEKTDQEPLR